MEPIRKEIIIIYDPTKGVPTTSKDLRQARKDVEARLDEIGARMGESAAALKQLKQEKEMWELWLSIADDLQG
jgi:serine phosphatase RsbU (regulator of sigma subunit)